MPCYGDALFRNASLGLTHGCLGIVRDVSVGHALLEDALIADTLLGNAEAESFVCSLPWSAL